MLECDARRVQSFHMQCQLRILNIQWYDLISNDEISARTSLPSVLDIICARRLSLFGHVARLPHDTPAYSALTVPADIFAGGRPPGGWSRPRGRPCKSWLDQILVDRPTPVWSARACALDHGGWHIA